MSGDIKGEILFDKERISEIKEEIRKGLGKYFDGIKGEINYVSDVPFYTEKDIDNDDDEDFYLAFEDGEMKVLCHLANVDDDEVYHTIAQLSDNVLLPLSNVDFESFLDGYLKVMQDLLGVYTEAVKKVRGLE